MQPVNLTVDLCSILGGALCPLPTLQFNGSDNLPLPSGIDVASHLPGIAYKIPDLEAFAQLTLVEVGTGVVKACVQSTLSNGWSARQRAVEWATGALALLAMLSALVHSVRSPEARAPFRALDLLGLYQTIGASALLALNYPLVYRSFAANFAWALGLFPAGPNSQLQAAINNMRHRTGGNLPDASGGSSIDLVNRRLSPYNLFSDEEQISQLEGLMAKLSSRAVGLMKRDVATVTAGSANELQAGIPVFVGSLGIGTGNAFITIFLIFLMLSAIMFATGLLLWLLLRAFLSVSRRSGRDTGKLEEWREYYPLFSRAWVLRLVSPFLCCGGLDLTRYCSS